MTLLIIAGLVVLCFITVGVIAYLVVALDIEHVRERQRLSEGAGSGGVAPPIEQMVPLSEDSATDTSLPADPLNETVRAPANLSELSLPPGDTKDGEANVFSLALAMDDFFNRTAHPKDLMLDERFEKGVELLRYCGYAASDLLNYSRGSNIVVACMALEALARRDDAPQVSTQLLAALNELYFWPRYFALRALDRSALGKPLLARLLTRVNSSWRDFIPSQSLRDLVARRITDGESLTLDDLIDQITRDRLNEEQLGDLTNILTDMGDTLPQDLRTGYESWRSERVDLEFIKSFGRVWGADNGREIVLLDSIAARVRELETTIADDPPRSIVLVGDAGVGKTASLRALANRLRKVRWTVFEATAADMLSGQSYIGQLEGRIQTIVRQVGGKRALWVIPNFHELLWAGRHQYSPVSVLDLLFPSIESGQLRIIGEVPTAAYEQLVRLRPKVRNAMQIFRVAPLADDETLDLARRWASQESTDGPGANKIPRISEEVLHEAFQLARQYLADKAAPGNLLLFLEATRQRIAAANDVTSREIELDDLLVTLSQLTGLPVSILDEREGLDLGELRTFFERRVLGQPEAVECLIERVAMIKAGLTDPTRPQGVFLFVGPTGTGKTEIAKALAEFLFGSAERMIRLDMSEFQSAEALDRILGESHETSDSGALVNLIRKQPFSVVLLDEFEKAHANVWDLFLQVFDDGRLTDRRGNTADFRHCVVIMTSNLGATLPHGDSIGFSGEQAQFTPTGVERAVSRTFRREFVNRIDRVVVFRPLGIGIMRELLRKELNDVLGRRGLRTRQWAVEWDDSAIDFLLRKGFTADLGARPLKRAIERYVLSPLAMTIVNHQFPEGDQFLFLRSAPDGESIDVQFVDPDAPDEEAKLLAEQDFLQKSSVQSSELRLETIALDSRGTPDEVQFLQHTFRSLLGVIEKDEWRSRKNDALAQTQLSGFWDQPERFAVLGMAEYMDRIEAGLDTAGSLLARLAGHRARSRQRYPANLVTRVAEQLYLVDAALRGFSNGEPRDAFLCIRAVREGADESASDGFAQRLTVMYRSWAEKRRMQLRIIEENLNGQGEGDGSYRAVLAVSGFGSYTILRPEDGLHVFETPQDEKSFTRAKAVLRVVGQPDEPASQGSGIRTQAEQALAVEGTSSQQVVVRRYREQPSPLVRDSVRGWRTGRIDLVFGGDFDLIS
jgi:ATP-dependent Clp protease ATP-binding subunit ClpC